MLSIDSFKLLTLLTLGSSTVARVSLFTVTEKWWLIVPARLVAKQVYVPEWELWSLASINDDPDDTGFSLWSQDIKGEGLPRAMQLSSNMSPSFLERSVGVKSVLFVKTGGAMGGSRDSLLIDLSKMNEYKT